MEYLAGKGHHVCSIAVAIRHVVIDPKIVVDQVDVFVICLFVRRLENVYAAVARNVRIFEPLYLLLAK